MSTGRVISSDRRHNLAALPASIRSGPYGEVALLHVITSPLIKAAAALVCRDGTPVLILRDGLLSADDLDVVQAVCSCVTASLAPLLDPQAERVRKP